MHRIFKNTSWLFLDRIIRLGGGVLLSVWMARYLGVEQFGILSYATIFAMLFLPLANLGLNEVAVRDFVRDPSSKSEILGTTLTLKLAGSILVLILASAAVYVIHPNDRLTQLLVVIIAAGNIFQAFDAIDLWFQSQVLSRYTVLAKNSAFLVIALVKIVLIIQKAPLVAFALAGAGEIALGSLCLLFTYRLTARDLFLWKTSLAQAKKLLKDSWPYVFSGLAVTIYVKIDQVILREMAGYKTVGIYAAAARISELWYGIPVIIVSSISPSLLRAKQYDEQKYHEHAQVLFSFMAGLALTTATLITVFSTPLILLLYGKSYFGAGAILAIHIWASVFVFLGVAQVPLDLAEGLMRQYLYRTVIGAALNIIFCLILIPHYSGVGAAIATVISYGFASFLGNAISKKTRHIFRLQVKALLFPRYLAGMYRLLKASITRSAASC
jgi:PST family polysaccharide transporter